MPKNSTFLAFFTYLALINKGLEHCFLSENVSSSNNKDTGIAYLFATYKNPLKRAFLGLNYKDLNFFKELQQNFLNIIVQKNIDILTAYKKANDKLCFNKQKLAHVKKGLILISNYIYKAMLKVKLKNFIKVPHIICNRDL